MYFHIKSFTSLNETVSNSMRTTPSNIVRILKLIYLEHIDDLCESPTDLVTLEIHRDQSHQWDYFIRCLHRIKVARHNFSRRDCNRMRAWIAIKFLIDRMDGITWSSSSSWYGGLLVHRWRHLNVVHSDLYRLSATHIVLGNLQNKWI